MSRIGPAALLALVLGLLPALPAAAFSGNTSPIGGNAGGRFFDNCNPGEALIGITWAAGKDLERAIALCASIHPDGERIDGEGYRALIQRGMNNDTGGDKTHGTLICPPGMVVYTLRANVSSVNLIHKFAFVCRNLATREEAGTVFSDTKGGVGGNIGAVTCESNGFAYGLLGRSDASVNALGLMCAPWAATVAPQKPIKHTARGGAATAQPDKPPIPVLTGDDAAPAAGGDGGGGASAATATTIYDQPAGNDVAYLSAGDAVTIVSCNGDNWCRISAPQQGWVWGDDLNR
jgi:hypothetical protein